MLRFNEPQQKAICHTDGPMMVLAGPGSGKTAVITERTLNLIRRGISPYSILVVTFTRAAAAEMRERFLKSAAEEKLPAAGVTFGTFHGIFYGILKNAWNIGGGNILADKKRMQLLGEILKSVCGREVREEAELPSQVGREISRLKENRIDADHFYSGVLAQDSFREVYRAYEIWKRENGMLDFDDIMTRCLDLFSDRPDILEKWRKKFQYISIDEFQDISPIQYDIMRLLAAPQNNLFIVGDDDQSIYRFRGASPGIMLGFPSDFKGTETVTLNRNYRCTPQILESAGRLISRNKKRYPKDLTAVRPDGRPVSLEFFSDPREECISLASHLRGKINAGDSDGSTAVLFRTNAGCREAVEQFMAYQVPFRTGDVIPCIYDHWIARDILAYMDLAAGGGRRSDFLRICNRPNRYISRSAFYEGTVSFDHLYSFYEDKDWMVRRIEDLENDLHITGRLAPYGAVQYIRRQIGYDDFLREYAGERGIPAAELFQILDEISESARNYKTTNEWKDAMDRFREKMAEQHRAEHQDENSVLITTLHASKGTEFDTVYILDVNEGVIPYHKAVLEEDIEEERRMLYVGMTRARKDLHLFAVRKKYEKPVKPSRFLTEIFG